MLTSKELNFMFHLCSSLVDPECNSVARHALIDLTIKIAKSENVQDQFLTNLNVLKAAFTKSKKVNDVIRELNSGNADEKYIAGFLVNATSKSEFVVDESVTKEQIEQAIKNAKSKKTLDEQDCGKCCVCGGKLVKNLVYGDLILGGKSTAAISHFYCDSCSLMYQFGRTKGTKK